MVAAAAMRLAHERSRPLVFARELPVAAGLRRLGFPVVVELHTLPAPAAMRWLRRLARGSGFGVLAISAALEEDLRSRLPGARDLASYHDGAFLADYPPLSQEERQAVRAAVGLSAEQRFALYTGSLYKGEDVRGLKRLAHQFPQIEFVIAGGAGDLLKALRQHCAETPNIRCIGQQEADRVRALQQTADFLLYPLTRSNPLWRHTSPLKLFEYMAAGGTIVGSNIGSVGEVLDEDCGYVFDGDDPAAMARAFARALDAPAEVRAAKAERCRTLVRERYDWARRVEFILQRWGKPQPTAAGRP